MLTDQQWELIEPLLPLPRQGQPRVHPLRRVLDTIRYVRLKIAEALRIDGLPGLGEHQSMGVAAAATDSPAG